MKPTFVAIALAALAARAHSAEIHVLPGQSIQAAIDAAAPLDQVVVHPGTYHEAIEFKGKHIVVRSLSGPAVTTIDATGLGSRVVQFKKFETGATRIEGFTIRGGNGGISCEGTSPRILGCVIRDNDANERGGGVYAHGEISANPVIEDCTIEDNRSTDAGGGVCVLLQGAALRRCTIRGNDAFVGGGGGGIALVNATNVLVEDCRIEDNHAQAAGGGMRIAVHFNDKVTVRRTTVAHNTGASAGGIHVVSLDLVAAGASVALDSIVVATNTPTGIFHSVHKDEVHSYLRITNSTLSANAAGGFSAFPAINGPLASLRNCIAWGNGGVNVSGDPAVTSSDVGGGFAGTGNFDSDPLFTAAAFDDWHLRADSPCRNAGSLPTAGLLDFEGDPRDFESAVDVGADEFHPHFYAQVIDDPLGSIVRLNAIGAPGAAVGMLFATALADPPIPTPMGVLWIAPLGLPPLAAGVIPPTGWLLTPLQVRPHFGPAVVFGQAFVGGQLTNAAAIALP